jgi:hypothetical protein
MRKETNMTKEQKRQALALIATDCENRFRYLHNGQTCAVGCLARAAGVRDSTLIIANEHPIGAQWIETISRMRDAILSKFGLTPSQLQTIQALNDGHTEREERVAAVTKYLNDL